MSSFFISYSRKDLAFAETLRKHIQLMDSGHDVFLDLYKIKTGVRWKQYLLSSVRKNDFFILILSNNSAISTFVQQEVKWVQQDELKTGVRKLFIIRIDDVPIPTYMSTFQVLNATGNFVIDFYKLMEGINGKASYFKIMHEKESDSPTGYWIKLYVDAPLPFLQKIEKVEYRFDYEFQCSKFVDAVEIVENKRGAYKKNYAVEFWISEPILVFIVLYLKSMRQITFEHRIPLYF
ncbi:hypothetical protein A4D02_35540 [Niastella koreensis]|uniref:TIR domain-containing protein n=2 Tax=Niastella koreensis TaxID=354356 RepID=G8TJE6_NIAKG|nr:toll/interleukin-1 receptor domain-containing protein [Niastella koreensis]AEV99681.1 hypothetical protein Niako_3372 [Niastella koreensis GR20-10]OQP44291.1 hypothetical protein A4D02_35540 [Niastella koreensis]